MGAGCGVGGAGSRVSGLAYVVSARMHGLFNFYSRLAPPPSSFTDVS